MIACHCRVCDQDFVRLRRRGDMEYKPPCRNRARVAAWKQDHHDRVRQYPSYSGTDEAKRKWASSEGGKANARDRSHRWYWKDPEHARALQHACYARDPDAAIQSVVRRSKRLIQQTPSWADQDAIAAIYQEARRMTRETGIPHEVDHVIPLHGRTISGLHVHYNLRVVTAQVNRCKSNHMPMDGNA